MIYHVLNYSLGSLWHFWALNKMNVKHLKITEFSNVQLEHYFFHYVHLNRKMRSCSLIRLAIDHGNFRYEKVVKKKFSFLLKDNEQERPE